MTSKQLDSQNSEKKFFQSEILLSNSKRGEKRSSSEKETFLTTNLLIIPLVKSFITKLRNSCSLRSIENINFKILSLLDFNPKFYRNNEKENSWVVKIK